MNRPDRGGGPRTLAAELEAVAGVRRALVEGPPWRALLVWDGIPDPTQAEWLVRSALQPLAEFRDVELEFAFLTPPEPRRRVRFLEVEVRPTGPATALVAAVVEWAGQRYHGEVEGEYAGVVADLRLTVAATLNALEAAVGERLGLHSVGVKHLRIFDQDMIVVLLRTDADPGCPLVGSCLADADVHGGTVLAVLSATNRLLGNYLHVGD